MLLTALSSLHSALSAERDFVQRPADAPHSLMEFSGFHYGVPRHAQPGLCGGQGIGVAFAQP